MHSLFAQGVLRASKVSIQVIAITSSTTVNYTKRRLCPNLSGNSCRSPLVFNACERRRGVKAVRRKVVVISLLSLVVDFSK
jgi:hypothetical protein